MNSKNKIKYFFTITELIVSMGIFAFISVFTLRIFSGVQNTWTATNEESDSFENARIAMDLISEDLKNIVDFNKYDSSLNSSTADKYFSFYCPYIKTSEYQKLYKRYWENNFLLPDTEATGPLIAYMTSSGGTVHFSGFYINTANSIADGPFCLYRLKYTWDNEVDSPYSTPNPYRATYPLMEIDQTRTKCTKRTCSVYGNSDIIARCNDDSHYTNTVFQKLEASKIRTGLYRLSSELILENVFSCTMNFYDKQYRRLSRNMENIIPDYIIIELQLIDPAYVEAYNNAVKANMQSQIDEIKIKHVRTYKRLISIKKD